MAEPTRTVNLIHSPGGEVWATVGEHEHQIVVSLRLKGEPVRVSLTVPRGQALALASAWEKQVCAGAAHACLPMPGKSVELRVLVPCGDVSALVQTLRDVAGALPVQGERREVP